MIEFYGSLISSCIGAAVGVFGSLYGAKIGGDKSYKAAMDAVTLQIQNEKDAVVAEREQSNKLAVSIIESFLSQEIRENYRRLTTDKGTFIKMMKNPSPLQYSYNTLQFEEFDKIKYELIKYESQIIKETMDIYELFYILSRYNKIIKMKNEELRKVRLIFIKHLPQYT